MIARELRLRRRFDFQRVRRRGRSWPTHLIVLVILSNDLGHNRYGFAVGKRVGGAVARNRVKRRLREAIRRLHPTLIQGYDIVIIARGTLADADVTFVDVLGCVEQASERAGLRCSAEAGCRGYSVDETLRE